MYDRAKTYGTALMETGRAFKCRVLVIDDDPVVLETTAAVVRSSGFSVRTAEDGFVALKILREVLPDLIISDLRMPGMSGFELLSLFVAGFLTSQRSPSAASISSRACPSDCWWTISFKKVTIPLTNFSRR